MPITLKPLDPTGTDRDALVTFLTENQFPFHVRRHTTQAEVHEAIDRGDFDSAEQKTFWLLLDGDGDTDSRERVGIVRLEDLEDPTPLFDLRLGENYRGRGLGGQALRATTDHVFTTMPAVDRFEGQTREDNIAMRRIFLREGWVKEAHYREAWPVSDGPALASVAYAILRRDWQHGTVTPLIWDDVTL